ncbi:MAG TPA: molybdopterin converting factor [Clostridiales bacterium UBA8153]|nr:molybdopterin converting factor [Clostridiales bacterium UBA8153]
MKLFASLADAACVRELRLELPAGSTGHALKAELARLYPALGRLAAGSVLAINRAYSGDGTVLVEGDEVALIPPVSGGGSRVWLTGEPLDARRVEEAVASERAGALVTFQGVVRGVTAGRQTRYLEYEAYSEMALERLEAVRREAEERWAGVEVAVAHRTGRLEVGEASVVISVASPHRRAGLEAAAYVIDRIKETAPIWKREVWTDGSEWVMGQTPR